jgi:hypothetical protein
MHNSGSGRPPLERSNPDEATCTSPAGTAYPGFQPRPGGREIHPGGNQSPGPMRPVRKCAGAGHRPASITAGAVGSSPGGVPGLEPGWEHKGAPASLPSCRGPLLPQSPPLRSGSQRGFKAAGGGSGAQAPASLPSRPSLGPHAAISPQAVGAERRACVRPPVSPAAPSPAVPATGRSAFTTNDRSSDLRHVVVTLRPMADGPARDLRAAG